MAGNVSSDSSYMRTGVPTSAITSFSTRISVTTPLKSDGTSKLALSVSISTMGWLISIFSPTSTRILTTVPESIFSPSGGRLKGVAIGLASPSYKMIGFGLSASICISSISWLSFEPFNFPSRLNP